MHVSVVGDGGPETMACEPRGERIPGCEKAMKPGLVFGQLRASDGLVERKGSQDWSLK
jgi:hypothetical protein